MEFVGCVLKMVLIMLRIAEPVLQAPTSHNVLSLTTRVRNWITTCLEYHPVSHTHLTSNKYYYSETTEKGPSN